MIAHKGISDQECNTVRNYIMGNLMMQLDGPFRSMEVIKTYVLEEIPLESFTRFVESIRTMDPAQVRNYAEKYLPWDGLHQVYVFCRTGRF